MFAEMSSYHYPATVRDFNRCIIHRGTMLPNESYGAKHDHLVEFTMKFERVWSEVELVLHSVRAVPRRRVA